MLLFIIAILKKQVHTNTHEQIALTFHLSRSRIYSNITQQLSLFPFSHFIIIIIIIIIITITTSYLSDVTYHFYYSFYITYYSNNSEVLFYLQEKNI